MGPPGDGGEGQAAEGFSTVQHPVLRPGGLAVGTDFPQEAGQGLSGDGGIDGAPVVLWAAQGQGVVGFPGPGALEQGAGVAVLGNQHDAEGVPVQPRQGMKGTGVPGTAVVPGDGVGKGSGISGGGGVNEHSLGLVHCQEIRILI